MTKYYGTTKYYVEEVNLDEVITDQSVYLMDAIMNELRFMGTEL